jgi:hypothetical protein
MEKPIFDADVKQDWMRKVRESDLPFIIQNSKLHLICNKNIYHAPLQKCDARCRPDDHCMWGIDYDLLRNMQYHKENMCPILYERVLEHLDYLFEIGYLNREED